MWDEKRAAMEAARKKMETEEKEEETKKHLLEEPVSVLDRFKRPRV